MMEMSRGSFVGNQLAGTAVYLGATHQVFNQTIELLKTRTFVDTGKSIGTSPFHQVLIGKMMVDMEAAFLWMKRQLQLETSNPPIREKEEVVRQWRLCKGQTVEAAFRVACNALKAGGTSMTANSGFIARSLRDLSMGLVQAFPAERGQLEAAKSFFNQEQQNLFAPSKD